MDNIMIDKYLSEEDKVRIAKDVFENMCRKIMQKDFERIITNSAYEVVWEAVEKYFDGEVEEFLKNKVLDILDDMDEFNVFRKPNAWDRPANSPYTLLCEQVKLNRDLLDSKVKSAIDKLTEEDVKKIALDLVKEKLL